MARIVLDQNNEEKVNKFMNYFNIRSQSAAVNELLDRIEIKIPNKKMVELNVDDFDINKVKKNDKRN